MWHEQIRTLLERENCLSDRAYCLLPKKHASWTIAVKVSDRFGASAPGEIVLEKLGITPENVANKTLGLLGRPEGAREMPGTTPAFEPTLPEEGHS